MAWQSSTRELLVAMMIATMSASFALRAEANSAPKKEGEGAESAPPAETNEASDGYVHHWLPMPSFSAQALGVATGDPVSVASKPGRMLVLVFLASYCEPCQQLMGDLSRVEARFRRLNTDFVYVFAHDTQDDALGFMKEFNMPTGVLANFDALKAYHNPKLPTIYVGDRHGWLMTRYEEVTKTDIQTLDELLRKLTAY